MNTKINIIILFLCIAAFKGAADTTIVHAGLNYTIYLPDNWVLEHVSDSQHIYYDTTWTFASHLSLIRHMRNAADFPLPEDWVRAHFIAYKLVAETSLNPWAAVLYYDSSDASVQGGLWAPELYTMFFSADTALGAWSEYIRFASSDSYGYDLYALGDTADMLNHIDTYAAILQGIELPGSNSALIERYEIAHPRACTAREAGWERIFNALGREVLFNRPGAQLQAQGLYARPGHMQAVRPR